MRMKAFLCAAWLLLLSSQLYAGVVVGGGEKKAAVLPDARPGMGVMTKLAIVAAIGALPWAFIKRSKE